MASDNGSKVQPWLTVADVTQW